MSSSGALFVFPEVELVSADEIRRLLRLAIPPAERVNYDEYEHDFMDRFYSKMPGAWCNLYPRNDPDTLSIGYMSSDQSVPHAYLYGSTERIEVFRRAWSAARRIAVEFGAHGLGTFGLDLTELPFADRSFYKTPQSRVLNITLFPQPYRDRIPDEMIERFDQLVELDNGVLEAHIGWPFEGPDDFTEKALNTTVMKVADDRLFEFHQFLNTTDFLETIFPRGDRS